MQKGLEEDLEKETEEKLEKLIKEIEKRYVWGFSNILQIMTLAAEIGDYQEVKRYYQILKKIYQRDMELYYINKEEFGFIKEYSSSINTLEEMLHDKKTEKNNLKEEIKNELKRLGEYSQKFLEKVKELSIVYKSSKQIDNLEICVNHYSKNFSRVIRI